ncbi:MAG TPA: ABC transporter ATP-binding protein [Methanoregulaceae archaeon]|nr:ABC transporter ATP-binding protein [Methanoregulaceae archaeon]
MSDTVISAESLAKKYGGTPVLDGVSFSVKNGEIFGLIGPSGSGKSTLIRLLDLLEMPSGGTLTILGQETRSSRARFDLRRRMGLLNQKPVIFAMSVHDNIALGMKYRGKSREEINSAVHDALRAIDLPGYGKRMARTLSGGEAQRVALARSIVTGPEILFLDEPTANLDPLSAEKIEELVLGINRDLGTTIVISTHDMLQGQKLAGRIGVILEGGIPQIGTTSEIFHRPATRKIARFVGVENIIPGTVTKSQGGEAAIALAVPGITVQAISEIEPGTHVTVIFRAEDVTIHLRDISGTSARNVFFGRITSMISSGPFVNVVVDCGLGITCLVTVSSAEELGLSFGKEVWISFKATAVHVIRETPDK